MKNYFHLNPKHLNLISFALTIPTLFFWEAVVHSFLTHDHVIVDTLLSVDGIDIHALLCAIFPITSLILAVLCRVLFRRQAIAHNVWHSETLAMKVNQNLISWCVMLISIMVLNLIMT